VLRAHHRGLHEEEISAGLGDGGAELQGGHRRGAHRRDAAALLDLSDPEADQVFAHGLAVKLLHQRYKLLLSHRRDAVEHRLGIVVTALHAFEVEDTERAEPAELRAHAHIHHAIHGAGDDRDLALDAAEAPAAVGDGRIDRAAAGHQGDLIDSVGASHGAGSA
jgi:hypothetical protein